MVKTCFKCETEKPLSEFYKHREMADGHLNKCKECAKRDAKSHNKTYCNIVWGDGKATEAWRIRNPKQLKANTAVNNAVRDKKLTRPNTCENCGKECKPHGHHEDYNKPLDVVWLCITCHNAIHSG